jgi:hypothetical protein
MLKICPVAMLKDSTKEVQASPSGMKQHAIDHLREIYRLRDKQERYERGEIGENRGIFQTSPVRADGQLCPPPDGGTIIPVESLPTESHQGSNPARGRQEPTIIATTNKKSLTTQNSPKAFSKAAARPDSENSQQEAAIEDEILVHLSNQQSNQICQLSGQKMQAPAFKNEEKEISRATSNIQNDCLYNVSALELQATRHNARLEYRNVGSAHLDLTSTSHRKAGTRFCESYVDAGNASFGDSSELRRNHGLPQVSTWNGFNGSLTPTSHSGSSTLDMPFFDDEYVFGNTLMNSPYRSSTEDVFAKPLGAGGHGQSWDFSFAHLQQR